MKFIKQSKNKRRHEIKKRLKKSAKYLKLRRKRKVRKYIDGTKAVGRKYSTFLKHLFVLFIVFSSLYVLYQITFVSDMFQVKSVILVGDFNYVNYSDMLQVVNSATNGKNIFLISPVELSEVLSKNFLAAQNITIKKGIPDKLTLKVTERTPTAVVNSPDGHEDYVVDSEGFVLGTADEKFSEFPRVEYGEDILVGKFLNQNLIPLSMEIISSADENDLKVSSMSFSENYAIVFMEPNFEVYLSNNDNVSHAFEVIAAMIKKLTLEGKTVSKIDLRYDKVVVSY